MNDSVNGKFILCNEKGEEKICNVIIAWAKNNVKYVAYTLENDPSNDLLVSKYNIENGKMSLIPIISDEEWEYVEKYLEVIL